MSIFFPNKEVQDHEELKTTGWPRDDSMHLWISLCMCVYSTASWWSL